MHSERRPFWILSSCGLTPKRESRPTETRREAWEAGQKQSQPICKRYTPELSQSVLKQRGASPPPTLHHPSPQERVDGAPKWTNLSTPLFLRSDLQGYRRTPFHMCRQVWSLLDLESHNPPERIKTCIHLQSVQRQIKQLSKPVCLGQETIKTSGLVCLESLCPFPPFHPSQDKSWDIPSCELSRPSPEEKKNCHQPLT